MQTTVFNFFLLFSRADPNQTVQLTPDEYQLGLEAVREFSLSSYGTERCVWADPMKNTGSSPGSSGVPSSGFTYRTAASIREGNNFILSTIDGAGVVAGSILDKEH